MVSYVSNVHRYTPWIYGNGYHSQVPRLSGGVMIRTDKTDNFPFLYVYQTTSKNNTWQTCHWTKEITQYIILLQPFNLATYVVLCSFFKPAFPKSYFVKWSNADGSECANNFRFIYHLIWKNSAYLESAVFAVVVQEHPHHQGHGEQLDEPAEHLRGRRVVVVAQGRGSVEDDVEDDRHLHSDQTCCRRRSMKHVISHTISGWTYSNMSVWHTFLQYSLASRHKDISCRQHPFELTALATVVI